MKRLLATLAALLLASSAHAFTISSVQIQPGFFTAGVRVFCAGVLDTTQTITCQLYIRRATGDQGVFSLGTTAFRRPGFTNAFDGIFIGLTPGQDYVARVVVNATGQSEKLLEQSFTTRIRTWANMGGSATMPMVYVSNSGVDGGPATAINTTCTSAAPCLTIHHADSVLAGVIGAIPNQGRGGAIVLRPGVYRTTRATAAGFEIGIGGGRATPDSMYHLMGDGTNPDSTIIDCTEERGFTWVSRGVQGVAGDSCWAAAYQSADSTLFLERGWGDIYPLKESIATLHPSKNSGAQYTGARGWFRSAAQDSIIIKTPDGQSPTNTTEMFHLGYRTSVQTLHPYWAISNLTIRGGNARSVVFGSGSGLSRGSGGVLDSVRVLVGNDSGIINDQQVTVAGYQDSILVRNCTFEGRRSGIPYPAFVIPGLWGHGIQFSCGFANTAYNNVVRGNFLGYEGFNSVSSTAPGDTITSCDNYVGSNQFLDNTYVQMDLNGKALNRGSINAIFENNLLRGYPSSGIPSEGSTGIAWDNPPQGPQWVIRNHVYGGGGNGINNLAGGGAGGAISTLVFYHNTISGTGGVFYDQASNADRGRIISRNNIYAAKKQATDANVQAVLHFNVDQPTAYDFDYDMLDSTTKNFSMVRWGLTNNSLVAMSRDFGLMAHSFQGAYSSVDSTRTSAWPATVTSGSAANVDAGVVIPGINTQLFGKPRYYGTAPDIGAYEWIAPTDSLHRPLNPNNRLWIKK